MMAGQAQGLRQTPISCPPVKGLDGKGGILFEDGWILSVGAGVTRDSVGAQTEVVDCKGKHIIPGLVDMARVHGRARFRIP